MCSSCLLKCTHNVFKRQKCSNEMMANVSDELCSKNRQLSRFFGSREQRAFILFNLKILSHVSAKKGLRQWNASGHLIGVASTWRCHFERFADYQRHSLLRAHNLRRRLILRLLPLPHPRSMQLMLKAAILAILQTSSVSPRQKATKSQKSKKNAAQPRLQPEKWSKKRSQKRGGLKRDSPLKFKYLSLD